ncbi:hypothetical protein T12_3234 [Trichinella patagoniensis]|uniref:Uncharacterized protein n=1 Tax=Trichinella patagoniensis TaxID=990121 RepID=A0A0V1A1C3_9BILA|nr:hypothetical protein T12_3234 [Trichinella patagoniensis]
MIINATNDVIDNVKIEDLVLELDLIERMTIKESASTFSKSGQVYAVKRFMPSARHSELMKFSISCARLAFWQSPNTFDGTFDSESELSVASRTSQICGVKTTLLPYIAAHITELVLVKPGGDYVCKSLFAGTLPTALPASIVQFRVLRFNNYVVSDYPYSIVVLVYWVYGLWSSESYRRSYQRSNGSGHKECAKCGWDA